MPADYEAEKDWQSQKIRPYEKAHDLEVEMLEPELDSSGGTTDRRILNEAIERIERGEAEGLIVAQLDRLFRVGIEEALKVIRKIESAGGKVIAVADNFDADTPEGKLARNVFLSLGEMQLDRYKAQFMNSKRRAVSEKQIWPMSVVPIGYSCIRVKDGGDGKLKLDKREAEKVKKAFAARAAGKPWREVAELLAPRISGISGAQNVISNPVYLGETHLRVNGELVKKATHEAIVDRAIWEAAQWEPRPRASMDKDSPALLRGIIRCAGCSRTMTLGVFTKGQRSYRCNTRNTKVGAGTCKEPAIIAQGIVEPYVENLILPWLDSVYVESRPKTEHLAAAMKELEDAEAELATYQTAMKGLAADKLQEGLSERIGAVEAATEKVREIQREGSAPLTEANGSLADAWPDLSIPERNLILSSALGVVWVRKGKILPTADPNRVRVIESGFEPSLLSRSGRGGSVPLVSIPDGNLEGQIVPLSG